MNIIHLHTLQTVVKTGSLRGAAQKLGYTTSAVSQQIASLEKSVGVSLFERGPRSLWPTPAGEALVKHADTIITHSNEAEEEMRAYSYGTHGRLRVGVSGSAGAKLVPKALAWLVKAHPGATITVEDEGLLQITMTTAVAEGKVDLGIVMEYGLMPRIWPENVEVRTVLDEELVVIESGLEPREPDHRLAITDLSERKWVTNRACSDESENFYRICAAAGFVPQVMFTSNDFDIIRGLVKEGLGIALLPALALGTDRAIQLGRIGPNPPRRRVHTIYRKSDANPLLLAAVAALDRAATDFVAWASTAFASHLDTPIGITFGDAIS
ncbi:LysR family transcriptional regulator [Mycobacterium haemophilum]|uniref:LysR family transcriptional regulator n=1 Tax=Mycobacterium haemophilum TaxID=29311 RepID=UPI001B3C8846|nr:LysR family transcriptional regulator [Mycobacterium haemophilum]